MNEPGVWSVITMRPSCVSAEEIVRQCRILARAESRAAFARRLIAAGLENRSVGAVSAWLRDFGNESRSPADLNAVVGEAIYVTALDRRDGMPYVRYPESR